MAETGKFNAHLELGTGFALMEWQSSALGPGVDGAGRFEMTLKPWVGLELGAGYVQFFRAAEPAGYERIENPYLFSVGLGARFRPLNDEEGYQWPWNDRPDHTGNLWGNFWVDLHGNYYLTGMEHRFGGDLGLGYEFSVVDGLQVGPFARCYYVFQPESVNTRDSKDAWLLTFGLSFSVAVPPEGKHLPDTDKDGLYDPHDKCPELPEDMDNFKDSDGCPEEDNDEDGILDEDDECVNVKEDFDGFEDEDGCPEKDNDLDGLEDSVDKCPNEKEDFDKVEDDDGCVDPDNDGDGILDFEDNCPDEPETFNKFQDSDGCPEQDSDEDGVLDPADDCPHEAEIINGVDDDDGCPDEGLVEVRANQVILGERIFFDLNLVRIKTRGKEVLRQVADLIQAHPEYRLLSIEGHADRTGARGFNLKLSKMRAERVRDFLIEQGVESTRLEANGFGENAPWVSGGDIEARKKNRRVEIIIKDVDDSWHTAKATKDAVDAVRQGGKEEESTKEQPQKGDDTSQSKDKGDDTAAKKGAAGEKTSASKSGGEKSPLSEKKSGTSAEPYGEEAPKDE